MIKISAGISKTTPNTTMQEGACLAYCWCWQLSPQVRHVSCKQAPFVGKVCKLLVHVRKETEFIFEHIYTHIYV